MNSDLLDTTPDPAPRHELRLTMTPETADGVRVDGSWQPWTTDPAAEFPALIGAMAADGAIHRVSYNLDAWDHVGRRLAVDGKSVRMEGFHTMRRDAVTLSRLDDTRIQLRVVPPDGDRAPGTR